MAAESDKNITRLLLDWGAGNQSALDALFPLVYEELRHMAQGHLRGERSSHTLQRTALVHEAFLRLVDQREVTWQSRAQFFGLASRMMRRILVDHARRRGAGKRGSNPARVDLDELVAGQDNRDTPGDARPAPALSVQPVEFDFVEFEEVLQRLEALEPRPGKLVELRFFGGLSLEESAEVLEISLATAKRDWTLARAWLQRALGDADPNLGQ